MNAHFVLAAGAIVVLTGCSGQAPSTPSIAASSGASSTPRGQSASDALYEGKLLVGLSESAAQAKAQASGFVFDVVERDGHGLNTSQEYSLRRIDVIIVNGVVTKASMG